MRESKSGACTNWVVSTASAPLQPALTLELNEQAPCVKAVHVELISDDLIVNFILLNREGESTQRPLVEISCPDKSKMLDYRRIHKPVTR